VKTHPRNKRFLFVWLHKVTGGKTDERKHESEVNYLLEQKIEMTDSKGDGWTMRREKREWRGKREN
jgi:hypothetical protein